MFFLGYEQVINKSKAGEKKSEASQKQVKSKSKASHRQVISKSWWVLISHCLLNLKLKMTYSKFKTPEPIL